MRFIIGCLALIGIGVVLLIGGCLGMIGIGMSHLAKIPTYATRAYMEKEYAADLAIIDKAITADKLDGLAAKVSGDVMAIYLKHDEILKKNKVTSESYSEMNGAGAGTLQTNTKTVECLVFQMKKGETEYEIFLVDHGPPAGTPATNVK